MPRNRSWADQRLSVVLTAGTGGLTFNLLENGVLGDTLTVVRIIGTIEIGINAISEIEYAQLIDIGIGVASVEAFAAAGVSLPSPLIDTEFPPRGWLYVSTKECWQFKAVNNEQQRANAIFNFDVRAARKIDKGRLFIRLINSDLEGASFTVRVVGRVRTLCLT